MVTASASETRVDWLMMAISMYVSGCGYLSFFSKQPVPAHLAAVFRRACYRTIGASARQIQQIRANCQTIGAVDKHHLSEVVTGARTRTACPFMARCYA